MGNINLKFDRINKKFLKLTQNCKKNGSLSKIKSGSEQHEVLKFLLETNHEIDFNSKDWKIFNYQEQQEILFIKSIKKGFANASLLAQSSKDSDFISMTQSLNNEFSKAISQLHTGRSTWNAFWDSVSNCLNSLLRIFTPKYSTGFFETSDQLLQEGKLLVSELSDIVDKYCDAEDLASNNINSVGTIIN